MTDDKRSIIMGKVQKLLAKADSTEFGGERDALLGKVDDLMTEYAIAQHEIDALRKPEDRSKPELREVLVCGGGTHLWHELTDLAWACANMFDCRAVFSGLHSKGAYPITMRAVGFPESLASADALFTGLKLQLLGQLEPNYNHLISFEENMVCMKAAGVQWKRQHEIYVAAGAMPDEPFVRNIGVRFTATYSNYCKRNGIEQIKANPKNYQVNFTLGYVEAIRSRIAEIKEERRRNTQDAQSEAGTSVALVLKSRQEEVSEEYDRQFPNVGRGISAGQRKANSSASRAGASAGRNADMGGKSMPSSRKALG